MLHSTSSILAGYNLSVSRFYNIFMVSMPDHRCEITHDLIPTFLAQRTCFHWSYVRGMCTTGQFCFSNLLYLIFCSSNNLSVSRFYNIFMVSMPDHRCEISHDLIPTFSLTEHVFKIVNIKTVWSDAHPFSSFHLSSRELLPPVSPSHHWSVLFLFYSFICLSTFSSIHLTNPNFINLPEQHNFLKEYISQCKLSNILLNSMYNQLCEITHEFIPTFLAVCAPI